MWDEDAEEDGWGILLVDARNAFNETQGSSFQQGGVTQGDPLAIISYALALLQVIAVLETLLGGLTYTIKQLQK
eukprot:11158907-Ditylum_brightwellii.AAC.1